MPGSGILEDASEFPKVSFDKLKESATKMSNTH